MKRGCRTFALLVACLGLSAVWLAGAEAAESEGKPSAAYKDIFPFVELDPLVLPMIQEGRVTHHVEFLISLEVAPEKKEWVKAILPKLLDRYIVELHGLLSLRFVRELPDLRPLLRERLIKRTKELVGAEAIKDVLLSKVHKLRPVSSRRTR